MSQQYIQDFVLAGKASILFEQGRLLESMKTFFGDGKEEKYRGQNIIFYIEEVRKIYAEKKIAFPIPSFAELTKINERSLRSLEKIVQKIEKLEASESFVDAVLDLD